MQSEHVFRERRGGYSQNMCFRERRGGYKQEFRAGWVGAVLVIKKEARRRAAGGVMRVAVGGHGQVDC